MNIVHLNERIYAVAFYKNVVGTLESIDRPLCATVWLINRKNIVFFRVIRSAFQSSEYLAASIFPFVMDNTFVRNKDITNRFPVSTARSRSAVSTLSTSSVSREREQWHCIIKKVTWKGLWIHVGHCLLFVPSFCPLYSGHWGSVS